MNTHPSTENVVEHTKSEDLNMEEILYWCTTEHYLCDYCLLLAVNLINPDEPKTFVEA